MRGRPSPSVDGMSQVLSKIWSIPVLMILSPLLAEVLGGAMPATDFFLPGVFFPFVALLYGLPVLVIRELAARFGYGPLGIWCLGMVYGLYNEGLFSETLYQPLGHPLAEYASYGLVGGLRLPWLLYILPWHALLSVLLPVLLVDRLFPKHAGRPWLPKRVTWCLAVAVPVLALARFVFLGEDRRAQDGPTFALHLAFVVVAALACWLTARVSRTSRFVPAAGRPRPAWRPVVAGTAFFALGIFGPVLLAQAAVPWPVPVLYSALVIVASIWTASRQAGVSRTTALLFVLGCGIGQAALAIVVGLLIGNIVWAFVGMAFAVVFGIVVVKSSAKGTPVTA